METTVIPHLSNNTFELPIFFEPEYLQDLFHILPSNHDWNVA